MEISVAYELLQSQRKLNELNFEVNHRKTQKYIRGEVT